MAEGKFSASASTKPLKPKKHSSLNSLFSRLLKSNISWMGRSLVDGLRFPGPCLHLHGQNSGKGQAFT